MKPSKCVEDNIFSLWPSDKQTGFKYSKRQLGEDDSNDKESTNNASRHEESTNTASKRKKRKARK